MNKIAHISSHRKYISRFPAVDLPKSFMVASEVLGLSNVGTPDAFYFRRRKGGTEIWIRFTGRFALNASAHYGINPKSFAEARIWAANFSIEHGFAYVEFRGKFIDLHKRRSIESLGEEVEECDENP